MGELKNNSAFSLQKKKKKNQGEEGGKEEGKEKTMWGEVAFLKGISSKRREREVLP